MSRKIHIVSFQNPYPPSYGGVIDVYYKIRELKNAGYDITLHTYAYGSHSEVDDRLRELVDKIYVYDRAVGMRSQLSLKPYIVNSRRDPRLIDNLLEDDAPIIFEGLHDCLLLSDKRLRDRLKIVRAHNVEHHYYAGLARSASSLKEKLYFAIESVRLRWFERVLRHADAIAAISEGDTEYFRSHYPDKECFHLPCFFDDTPAVNVERRKFVLYHGNLGVSENDYAALKIVEKIAPLIPDYKLVIAGASPSAELVEAAGREPNVELIADPSREIMDELMCSAQIALLLTFQATGIKLKLLSSLSKGAFVVVNSKMVGGTNLAEYCDVADRPGEIAELIKRRMSEAFMGRRLPPTYDNKVSCEKLVERLEELSTNRS